MQMRLFLWISDTCVVVKLTLRLTCIVSGMHGVEWRNHCRFNAAFAWASNSKTWISRCCFSIWSLISYKSWEFPSMKTGETCGEVRSSWSEVLALGALWGSRLSGRKQNPLPWLCVYQRQKPCRKGKRRRQNEQMTRTNNERNKTIMLHWCVT